MTLLETIYRWIVFKKHPSLGALPFEELQTRYENEPLAVYEEFIRRLKTLVFYAAHDYLKREHERSGRPAVERLEVEEKLIEVFREFGTEFTNGTPITILLRFATVIRRLLGDESFEKIACIYYPLLPTYHISNEKERRMLAAAYEEALSGRVDIDEVLAERFGMSVDEAHSILQKARQHLDQIVNEEFEPGELQEATEGVL